MQAWLRAGAKNDKASSLKVVSNGCPSDRKPKCRAELYQHGNFKGWRADFPEGSYDINAFRKAGARNDDASSIKVKGGKNCCAVVYEHGSFNGWAAEFREGDHNM